MGDTTSASLGTVGVKESFDPKYKSTIPKLIRTKLDKKLKDWTTATQKRLDAEAAKQKPPGAPKNKDFSLDLNFSLKKTDKGVQAVVTSSLNDGDKMFATGNSSSSTEVRNPSKIDDDVEAVAEDVANDVWTKAAKVFEGRLK